MNLPHLPEQPPEIQEELTAIDLEFGKITAGARTDMDVHEALMSYFLQQIATARVEIRKLQTRDPRLWPVLEVMLVGLDTLLTTGHVDANSVRARIAEMLAYCRGTVAPAMNRAFAEAGKPVDAEFREVGE